MPEEQRETWHVWIEVERWLDDEPQNEADHDPRELGVFATLEEASAFMNRIEARRGV